MLFLRYRPFCIYTIPMLSKSDVKINVSTRDRVQVFRFCTWVFCFKHYIRTVQNFGKKNRFEIKTVILLHCYWWLSVTRALELLQKSGFITIINIGSLKSLALSTNSKLWWTSCSSEKSLAVKWEITCSEKKHPVFKSKTFSNSFYFVI